MAAIENYERLAQRFRLRAEAGLAPSARDVDLKPRLFTFLNLREF
jgi:hypothetical protein